MVVSVKDILERVEPDELIDVLGLTTKDLCDILHEQIMENLLEFEYLDRGDVWYDE